MKPHRFWLFSVLCVVGLLSGCSGNDNVPIITPSGPTANVDDQRTSQSDELTSQEAALVSQADSEPIPAPLPDL
jgi:outer membrane murein-binding lipoprotein Lpp